MDRREELEQKTKDLFTNLTVKEVVINDEGIKLIFDNGVSIEAKSYTIRE